MVTMIEEVLSSFSAGEREAILSGTALKVYPKLASAVPAGGS